MKEGTSRIVIAQALNFTSAPQMYFLLVSLFKFSLWKHTGRRGSLGVKLGTERLEVMRMLDGREELLPREWMLNVSSLTSDGRTYSPLVPVFMAAHCSIYCWTLGGSRDQALPHPLDLSIPPTYPSCHNRTTPCIYFPWLNIYTRWAVTIATISPGTRYLLQGLAGQGGRTDAGQRWELACLEAVCALQPCAPGRRVPQGAGCLAGASLPSVTGLGHAARKEAAGRKGACLPTALPHGISGEQGQLMCFKPPTSNDCS